MADAPEVQDDEIDLGELFASLWAYKLLIGVVTASAIVAGGFYALNAEKTYTGEAVFKLEDKDETGLSLPSGVSGLSALAGLGAIAEEGNVLFDRVRGRVFITALDETVDLRGDPYFNSYNPNPEDPLWKALIKSAIGYESASQDPDRIVERNIVENFRENLIIEETENGAMSVKIDHTDPERAAAIANAVMDQVIEETRRDRETTQDGQLAYLSETLADTLAEMEKAQARLKNFAISNSTLSIESLARGSVALDEIRNRLERARELSAAANALLEAVESGRTNDETYAQLRTEHPIVDDVEFRRVLGISEIISEFTWPDREVLAAVSATLEDSRQRIAREQSRLEDEAINYASSAEEQAALQREAEIAEASYTVLIEQVKAQSLLAGYTSETAKIFERATPPLSPSKPNRILVVALAAVLGLFVGSVTALVLSLRKGVLYSRRAFLDEFEPTYALSAAKLAKFNGKGLTAIRDRLAKAKTGDLTEIAVILRRLGSRYAVVVGGDAKATARTTALTAAVSVANSGPKVAVIDLAGPKSTNDVGTTAKEHWAEVQSSEGVTELAFLGGRANVDLLASSKFDDAVAAALDKYELVVFSADSSIAEMSAIGLSGLDPTLLLVGRPRRTSKALVHQLRSLKLPSILLLE